MRTFGSTDSPMHEKEKENVGDSMFDGMCTITKSTISGGDEAIKLKAFFGSIYYPLYEEDSNEILEELKRSIKSVMVRGSEVSAEMVGMYMVGEEDLGDFHRTENEEFNFSAYCKIIAKRISADYYNRCHQSMDEDDMNLVCDLIKGNLIKEHLT
jgi:hypothetical protein